jgi:TrmH RNA methyltransferase
MAFFGLRRLLLSDHPAQSGLSDAAYRVAEGGLEYLDIRAIATVPAMLREFRSTYRVIATVVRGGNALSDLTSGSRPICLVLGNEERGLSKSTIRACESTLTLEGSGWVESLNVSAFAAVILSRISAMDA